MQDTKTQEPQETKTAKDIAYFQRRHLEMKEKQDTAPESLSATVRFACLNDDGNLCFGMALQNKLFRPPSELSEKTRPFHETVSFLGGKSAAADTTVADVLEREVGVEETLDVVTPQWLNHIVGNTNQLTTTKGSFQFGKGKAGKDETLIFETTTDPDGKPLTLATMQERLIVPTNAAIQAHNTALQQTNGHDDIRHEIIKLVVVAYKDLVQACVARKREEAKVAETLFASAVAAKEIPEGTNLRNARGDLSPEYLAWIGTNKKRPDVKAANALHERFLEIPTTTGMIKLAPFVGRDLEKEQAALNALETSLRDFFA